MSKSKKNEVFTSVNDIDIPETLPTLKFRYFCPACTGRAMYSVEPNPFSLITCRNCGTEIAYDANNWFEVTDNEEYRRINNIQ